MALLSEEVPYPEHPAHSSQVAPPHRSLVQRKEMVQRKKLGQRKELGQRREPRGLMGQHKEPREVRLSPQLLQLPLPRQLPRRLALNLETFPHHPIPPSLLLRLKINSRRLHPRQINSRDKVRRQFLVPLHPLSSPQDANHLTVMPIAWSV